MSDKPVTGTIKGFGVTAMEVTYQAQLIDGRSLAFVTAIDATVDRETLDGFLDTFIEASKRQQAIEEWPLATQNLQTNIAMLREQEKARAQLVATMQARSDAMNANRRVQREAPQQDMTGLAQFDERIGRIKMAIAAAKARIPYLRAIIDRKEPPELFPMTQIDDEDAAAAA